MNRGEMRWPKGFMNISDCSFRWVFDNKKEFVKFTLEKMDSPTGLFLEWKNYVLKQNRNGSTKHLGTNQEEVEETKEDNETSEERQVEE